MAIILKCDKCEKQMGSLEPHIIKDDKYLCRKCADEATSTSNEVGKQSTDDSIVTFYKNVHIRHINEIGL